MIKIIGINKQSITDNTRQAFSLAAAEAFLDKQEQAEYTEKLGEISKSVRSIANSILFYGPLTDPDTVVNLSHSHEGVVIVPTVPRAQKQVFYAAWLTN